MKSGTYGTQVCLSEGKKYIYIKVTCNGTENPEFVDAAASTDSELPVPIPQPLWSVSNITSPGKTEYRRVTAFQKISHTPDREVQDICRRLTLAVPSPLLSKILQHTIPLWSTTHIVL